MSLNDEQIERYSRHIILPEVGGAGQERLLAGSVLIVGAGGLGSPAALYLAAAGVGHIGLIDADEVDLSNLQRQVIHTTADIGRPKIVSASEKMNKINPDVKVTTIKQRLTAENALDIIKDYQFIIDGTDNFPSKFLVADACHFAGKPYSHAGILRFSGQTITVVPGHSACYRCLFQRPPPLNAVPSCSQAGVLGVLAGVMGCLQATEAVKYLLNKGKLLTDNLLVYDALEMSFRKVPLKKNKNCPLCGENPAITALKDEEQKACDSREEAGGMPPPHTMMVYHNMKLTIKKEVYNSMIEAALEAVPLEACGLLGGNDGIATEFYSLNNADASSEHYSMIPEEQFAAIKKMRQNGNRMLSIWHSHPASPARMSQEDIKLAFTPGIVYTIVSLETGTPVVRSFEVHDGIPVETETILKA